VSDARSNKSESQGLKGLTDRISEGHTDDCRLYGDATEDGGEGVCNCGYEQAIVDTLDAAARFEEWLDEATKNAVHKMETAKHPENAHDRETMVRTLNLVRSQYEGTT
jgi:hypothetical protein